ncbi:hypothetical protein HMPREF2955_12900 [Prevotella sp. HMSC073D09]|jgi:hypothetical protein|uniref:hypothetical protein n=1 Tax=Prevotella sp. HMSC073D09 TaxID=1739459 RepID=UPI0008A13E91|nr:hypothetical protein [Prevotella sp. HMSC073D09]OFQ14489.1 hypothetical protein HMPREF2955_12900 [Prevotella sp. HMSC073D09]
MKTRTIIISLTALLCAVSCKEETELQVPNPPPPHTNVKSAELDDEAVYRFQTDKNQMLNSMIRYDYTKKKYVLDISEQDARSIGITTQMYKDAIKRVEEMNKVNFERLQ